MVDGVLNKFSSNEIGYSTDEWYVRSMCLEILGYNLEKLVVNYSK